MSHISERNQHEWGVENGTAISRNVRAFFNNLIG